MNNETLQNIFTEIKQNIFIISLIIVSILTLCFSYQFVIGFSIALILYIIYNHYKKDKKNDGN